MANVAVATPHGGLVYPDYYRSVLECQGHTLQHTFSYVEVDTMIVSRARNALVEASRTVPDLDVLWFVDDDTLIPPHAGQLVDDALQLGVVSGVYFNRRPPYPPQIYRVAHEPEFQGMYWPVIDYPAGGLRPEDATGGGCMAVRTDVFDRLTAYWQPRYEAAGALLATEFPEVAFMVSRLSPWFEFLERKGEDLYFCERLKGIGQEVWVNYDVKCSHLSLVPIVEEHFNQLKAQMNLQPVATAAPDVQPGVVQLGAGETVVVEENPDV